MAPAWLKAPARRLLEGAGWYGPYKLATAGFLRDAGWFRSLREGRAVDRDGHPLPWITYAAIEFLARRVRPQWSVFEYGAGASTRWWASRVARLVSCEHDAAWIAELAPQLPGHVTLIQRPLDRDGEYARAIATVPGGFELVMIDGRDRVHCAEQAVAALKPDGVIVWDDTERAEYAPGIEALARQGFRRIEFGGLAPGKVDASETSIFYREQNCLGI